ncbi:GNAT family N-acetyltransferase [Scopulibacillus daqui]|uniref:GNAT family N-acetyltransferase n=1 Tax=Scopulibacillus daqui TaxID=1469162 RepID=UPI00196172F1
MGKTIAFSKVELERDVKLIHSWMNESHVIPFWGLDGPFETFKQHLNKALNDPHQTLYLGCLDGKPISYWESYWVRDDMIADYYRFDAADQGVHLLLGERAYLGKGLALPFLRAMVRFQFQVSETHRVVAEPDIRNEKMIHIFKKCGFEPIKPIELPDKTGLLMICRRDCFERK